MKFFSWGETTANLPGLQEHQNSTPFQVGHMSIWQRNQCCQSKALWRRSPLPARRGGNETSWPPHLLSHSNRISYTWYLCPKCDPEHTSIHPNLRGLFGWDDMKKGHTQDPICSFLQRRAKEKKKIMIKERLPSSPELKNKWETPWKSGKKILVRTTNCFNSLWWRRINA